VRTNEDTVGLVRRLAGHYPDAVIAGITVIASPPTTLAICVDTEHRSL
jgi:hypothetical protein